MQVKKPHPIVNKLQHAVRHNRLWRVRKFIDKKKESKKRGYYVIGEKYEE